MPTLACTAACRHCGSHSRPNRPERLDSAIIMESIRQAGNLGFAGVVFTGGEATLEWDSLLRAIRFASELGLPPRLVTNAHWAVSVDIARTTLDTLVERGLRDINFSTGDEHTRFVPMDYVVNAAVAAAERGIDIHIMVEYSAARQITKARILSHSLLDGLTSAQRESIRITESPWMPLDPLFPGCYAPGDTINELNVTLREGCPSVLRTYILEADGRVAACCGLGIGDIPELYVATAKGKDFLRRAIESAESDLIKLWLHCKGPERILAWAASKEPDIRWQHVYAHSCQVCQRIYKDNHVANVIRENYTEVITDIIQSLWFDEHYYPQRLASVARKE